MESIAVVVLMHQMKLIVETNSLPNYSGNQDAKDLSTIIIKITHAVHANC